MDSRDKMGGKMLAKPARLFSIVLILSGMLIFKHKLPVAYASNITVTTTQDELNIDGDCSLREAIQAANTNVMVDQCPAGVSTNLDYVYLSPGATYILSRT